MPTDSKALNLPASDKQHCVNSYAPYHPCPVCSPLSLSPFAYQGDPGDSALHKLFMSGELGRVLIVDYPELTPLPPISPSQPNHTPLQGIVHESEK